MRQQLIEVFNAATAGGVAAIGADAPASRADLQHLTDRVRSALRTMGDLLALDRQLIAAGLASSPTLAPQPPLAAPARKIDIVWKAVVGADPHVR